MNLFKLSEGTAARRRVYLHLVDATDGITPETGEASGQPQLSKNGASFSNTSATLTAVGNGLYYVELTAGELDTLGFIAIRYKSANTCEAQVLGQVVAFDPYDAVRAGLTALPNANAEASGGLITRGTSTGQLAVSSGRAEADVKLIEAADPTDTIRDSVLSDATRFPGASITENRLSELDAGTSGKMAAEVDIIKEANVIRRNTAQSGAAGSITLDASASSTTDFYKGRWILIVSGTGAGQARLCTAYNGTSKAATITPNWATNPDNTSVFIVLPAAGVDIQLWSGTAPNALISGRVDANAQVVGDKTGYTASTVSDKTGYSLAADQSGVTVGTVNALGTQAKADVNAEVDGALDTAIPGSPTANSINERVKTLDDNYTAARAPNLDNLDATVSSRATPAQVNAEVLDVLNVDTFGESSGVPAATSTLVDKIKWLFTLARNKITQTSTTQTLRNDADSGNISTSTHSDDGTTHTRGKWS